MNELKVGDSDAPLFSFTTASGTPTGTADASISLVLLVTNGVVTMFLKKREGEINTNKFLYGPGVNSVV